MKNETRRLSNGMIVELYNIITTNFYNFTVYEPVNGHSTIKNIDGLYYGDILTRPFNSDLQSFSNERLDSYIAHKAINTLDYTNAVYNAFPELIELFQVDNSGHIYIIDNGE